MIRYTPQSQLSLEGFETPFVQQLDKNNRWVKLAQAIPWDKLAGVYYKKMDSSFGAPSISARMVIGAVIIKHMLNIDDREVIEQIKENMYLQYFTGMSSFTTQAPFDASLMVSIRYRLGQQTMEAFNRLVLQEAGIIPYSDEGSADDTENRDEHNNPASSATDQTIQAEQGTIPANSGTLMVDATVAEQQIEYPTDLKLLNEGRQQLERMIQQLCKAGGLQQPRMYKQVARSRYLTIAKKKNKTHKQIRRGIRQQLQYVQRDLKYLTRLIEEQSQLRDVLDKRDWKLLRVIHELHRQQQEMYGENKHSIQDRIVSIYQPHVRPMPRGKDRVATEFGSKQLIMQKDGYTYIHSIEWDNFNEGTQLKSCVEIYKEIYGCYPEKVSADKLFGSKANRDYLKEKQICFVGKQLGRPPKQTARQKRELRKQMAQRNEIEGKFGQGKNAYGLQKIKARMQQTSQSWIMSIYFIMNLVKLMQGSFFDFINCVRQIFIRIQILFVADKFAVLKNRANFFSRPYLSRTHVK